MDLPALPTPLPPWLEAEVSAAAQKGLAMSEREMREMLATQITRATVDRFLRHQSLRQDEGESFEFEELHREEAIGELAYRLGVTDDKANALWTVAEEKLLR